MKVLLAHPGTQYSAQLARQLERCGNLYRFWTTFALPQQGFVEQTVRRLVKPPPAWLAHRIVPDVPGEKIRTIPLLEFRALLRLRFGVESQIVMHDRNERFQRAIPENEIKASDAV